MLFQRTFNIVDSLNVILKFTDTYQLSESSLTTLCIVPECMIFRLCVSFNSSTKNFSYYCHTIIILYIAWCIFICIVNVTLNWKLSVFCKSKRMIIKRIIKLTFSRNSLRCFIQSWKKVWNIIFWALSVFRRSFKPLL